MAEQGRPPPEEQPGELPRRVRGANHARIPTQVRRGYLPEGNWRGEDGAQGSFEDAASLVSLAPLAPTAPAVDPPPPRPVEVEQPPPPAVQPASPPVVPRAPQSVVANQPPPPPPVAPSALQSPATKPTAPKVKLTAPAPSRNRARNPARNWRAAGILIAVAAALIAVTALALARGSPATNNAGNPQATAGGRRIAAETAVRNQTVAWVASQVSRNIIVACDSVVCLDLAAHGFPPGNLNVLPPTNPDPYGSEVVISTADVRSQFGSRLVSVYAPEVIASFGTGTDRIDVRVIAPHGAATFQAALRVDLQVRHTGGEELLSTSRIAVSAAARADLESGLVDSRLLALIAFLAGQQPLSILGFGSSAPGASPGVPLRFAYLAETDAAAHLSSSSYLRSLVAILGRERPPYVPLKTGTVNLDGQPVLRIEFAAPSPPGLLTP